MFSIHMVLLAIVLFCISGIPAFLFDKKSQTGQRLTSLLVFTGTITGFYGIGMQLFSGLPSALSVAWSLPWSRFAVKIDSLNIIFLCLIFLIPVLGSLYGLGYWKQTEHSKNGRQLGLFYGLLAGSMAMVVIASDSLLFLIAWEIMALSAYFAATVEDEDQEVRQAGWIYLVATHTGTLCLFAMFVLWRYVTGSFALVPVTYISGGVGGTIFVLSLIGFGFKAGIMPLHVWLPGAHANAPSHVSAMMSGVMLKMGIYGIIRMTSLIPAIEGWWGETLLITGVVSGLAGIIFAIGQHDIKRILAYSSIENIGIICIGLGLALLGRGQGRMDWVFLGLGGALLHVWNHGLFKSLLFFNAGTIIHATHTREIDQLGGLGKKMPLTMLLFVVGAIAICALPPMNGFVSEWLLYIGLFRTVINDSVNSFPVATLGAIALAMIGPLALVCFIRVSGTVFLGNPRKEQCNHHYKSSATMMMPMVFLAMVCLFIGIMPVSLVNVIGNAVKCWAGIPESSQLLTAYAPMNWMSIMAILILTMLLALLLLYKMRSRSQDSGGVGTWDCGYAKPSNSMQYTGSSFGDWIVKLFRFVVWPFSHDPSVNGNFPGNAYFKSIVADTVLDRAVFPFFRLAARYIPLVRIIHKGQTHMYVLYILAVIIVLLIMG